VAFPEKWLRQTLDDATTAGIHPVLAPQNSSYPLVVYRRSGTRRERSLGGGHGRPVATFSVSIVTETYTEAKDIADSIRIAVDNFTGESNGVTIISTSLVSEADNMERPPEGQAKPMYRIDQVYEVRFIEIVQGGT
jgi:Protein of unknown function (DUF3168)